MVSSMKKKLLSTSLTVALAITVAGCSTGNGNGEPTASPQATGDSKPAATAEGAKTPDPVTLKVMLFGEKPIGFDAVLDEFYKQTKDTLNTTLDVEWSPAADHREKVKLRMAAGEKVDLLFDAPWMNMNTLIPQGAYIPLDDYFNNDEYPGLKKSFSQRALDANKMDGKNYYFPIMSGNGSSDGVYVRQDLREKYGLPLVDSYDALETYLKAVQTEDAAMVPYAVDANRGFFGMFKPYFTKNDPVITEIVSGAGAKWHAVFSPDYKQVLGAVTIGDGADKYAGFPAPYNNPDAFFGYFNQYREWNKYLERDAVSQKDRVGLFASGKAAALEGDIWNFNAINSKLQAGVPGAKLEYFPYQEPYKTYSPEAFPATYVAGNAILIPATSDYPDRAAAFVDWVFQSQENNDLFRLGIKGVDWEETGDKEFRMLSKYSFPSYELTSNDLYTRIDANLDDTSKKVMKYIYDPTTSYLRALSGFKFDTAPVKSEIAKVQPKFDEFHTLISVGLLDNPLQEAEKANKEWQSLGLEKIRAEIIKQLQAYIDAGGK